MGYCALSAAVGEVFDARIAGYKPAIAPMTTVTPSPAPITHAGSEKGHEFTNDIPPVTLTPMTQPSAPPRNERSSASAMN